MFVKAVRWPLMEVVPTAPLEVVPACKGIRLRGLRPSRGSSWICIGLTVLLNSPFAELIASAPATTVTFAVTSPTPSVGFRVYYLPTSIFNSVAVKLLKPVAVMTTVYVPNSSCGTAKAPSSLDVTVLSLFV